MSRPPLMPHGTAAAYMRHRRAGKPACAKCKAAWAKHQREYRRLRQNERNEGTD